MILPPVMGYMITQLSWRTSYALMSVCVFVLGIPAALLLKAPPKSMTVLQENSETTTKNQDEWTLHEAIGTFSFKLLFFIFTALAFCVSIVAAHLVAHVEDMGIAPVPASIVLTSIGGSGILGRIIIGGAADKVGNKIMLGSCLVPLALLMFWLVWAKELRVFYMIAALFGLTYGGALPVIMKMSSEYYGVSSSGTIFGVLLFGATAGGAIGAPLAGYTYDIFGNYAVIFLIGGIVITIASVFILSLKTPVKRKTVKEDERIRVPTIRRLKVQK
jgi:MFS family permease